MSAPTVGSTYRWELTATKDGAAWDLSAATVTLYLKDPAGTTTSFTASGNGGTNIRYYDSLTTDLGSAGNWHKWWKVVDGTVTQQSDPTPFLVLDPTAA